MAQRVEKSDPGVPCDGMLADTLKGDIVDRTRSEADPTGCSALDAEFDVLGSP